jgi:adenylate kinase family enzyme
MSLQRIAIIGNSGAGKTTLARSLGSQLGLVHIEMDGLFWQANWTPLSREAMRARVDQALFGTEKWVTDGNYFRATQEVVWSQADTIIWLDLPLHVVLLRLLWRTALRIFTRQELWNGNKEHFLTHLRFWEWDDNLFIHCVHAHFRHRRQFPALLAHPDNAHLIVLRFRSVAEVDGWLAGLPETKGRCDSSS